MPAPLAKGIIVSVSILVAAGIAVYENPQVRLWIDNSRRKIAVALHNLGDEINPSRSQSREDISMTEELSEEAEERRRKAREEIQRRASLLESRRRSLKRDSVGSFDTLVDADGNLKNSVAQKPSDETLATVTGLEQASGTLTHRNQRQEAADSLTNSRSENIPDTSPEEHRELLEAIGRERLHLILPSESASNHPSESLVDLTPTSETAGTEFGTTDHSRELQGHQQDGMEQSEFFSAVSSAASSRTEDGEPGFYYTHPSQPLSPATGEFHDISSAPSVAGNMSHIGEESTSDGTVSDFGGEGDGIYTPTSWSEVGSVISSNDGSHN